MKLYRTGIIVIFISFMFLLIHIISAQDYIQAPVFKTEPELINNQQNSENIEKYIGAYFDGESLEYVLSFLLFFNVAEAEITFQKDTTIKNGYIAELKAHTTGIISFLTSKRKEYVRSQMILSDDGSKLLSYRFEKISKRSGRKPRRRVTEFDYDNMMISWKIWNGDELAAEGSRPIPENIYYADPLCAFYNFRFGVYGDIQNGKSIDVKTVSTRQDTVLHVNIASKEETNKQLHSASKISPREYLVNVITDKDLFDSKNGEIELWLSDDFIPLEVIVKDVAVIGDVRGVLRQKKRS